MLFCKIVASYISKNECVHELFIIAPNIWLLYCLAILCEVLHVICMHYLLALLLLQIEFFSLKVHYCFKIANENYPHII